MDKKKVTLFILIAYLVFATVAFVTYMLNPGVISYNQFLKTIACVGLIVVFINVGS